MQLLMIGLNHRSADVALRERLCLTGARLDETLQRLRELNAHAELAALCTCNRTELYIARPELEPPRREDLEVILAQVGGVAVEQIQSACAFYKQDEAAKHLFEVAAGLDSMVLGEPQILGQVKRAYDDANARGLIGPILHRVFQEAIASAKNIRQQTSINEGRMSVGSVAVDFAKRIFSHFGDKTVLAVGAGEMAKIVIRHLHQLRPKQLWLTNRSEQRARDLMQTLRLTDESSAAVQPMDRLDDLLAQADIVLTSTASSHAILTAPRFKLIHRRRRARPLFLIDLALPRDVAPQVGEFSNVYLYNLDDLQAVSAETRDQRCAELQTCRAMIDQSVRAVINRIQHRDIGQLIRQLRNQLQALGEHERRRTLRRIESGALENQPELLNAILDEHTNRLINKFLHLPLAQLDRRDADAPLAFSAAALRHLFQLDDSPAASPTQPQPPTPAAAATPTVDSASESK